MCDKPISNKNRPELDGAGASSFFYKVSGSLNGLTSNVNHAVVSLSIKIDM